MKKKIFYWSPCLNPVGTVKSTINSAVSLMNYGNDTYEVSIINACGEWDNYINFFLNKNVKVINLRYKYFKYLPKRGFIQSRFSYLLIYFLSFFQLFKVLKKYEPNFLIAHLITSLPLSIMFFFNLKTKFVLRISGLPKLNILRKQFWKLASNKLFCVTCPTEELRNKLKKIKLFRENKLFLLPDAILDMHKFIKQKKQKLQNFSKFDHQRIIVSAGRLTKQKNFSYLINEFSKFCQTNPDFILIILGEGEEKKKLESMIIKKNLQKKIYLLGFVDNVYNYFLKSEIFVLSSKWEEVGFVIVEAALSNLFVISSNCPNGPTEFLENGHNGILFENNKSNALNEALNNYLNLKDINQKKMRLKKNSIKYSKFRHFLVLNKILSFNI